MLRESILLNNPRSMKSLFDTFRSIDEPGEPGGIIVSSRHWVPPLPSPPATRAKNTRTAHICIRKGGRRGGIRAENATDQRHGSEQEAARTWRGGGGGRDVYTHGLHSAFRERDTFYRGAPSLRQFAAHTKLCSPRDKTAKIRAPPPPRFFLLLGRKVCS